MKDYEGLLYEVQRERESTKYELESMGRELSKEQNLKKLEVEGLLSKQEEYQRRLDSKRQKT
jgi:hypothetical protein